MRDVLRAVIIAQDGARDRPAAQRRNGEGERRTGQGVRNLLGRYAGPDGHRHVRRVRLDRAKRLQAHLDRLPGRASVPDGGTDLFRRLRTVVPPSGRLRRDAVGRQDRFSGIEPAVGIDRRLHRPHQPQFGLVVHQGKLVQLVETNAMLAGDRASERDAGFQYLEVRLVDPAVHVGVIRIVGQIRVQVAVAGMALGRYQDAVFGADTVDLRDRAYA